MNVKYLILGAGPSGLTFANRLLQLGETDFLVIEKEKEAGGLCRSVDVDGSPLDIGGGHFLDVRNPRVLDFLFPFFPIENWDRYERDSKIDLNGHMINSPIEANIWQLPTDLQVEYLKAIAIAGCNLNEDMPEKFIDWITWKLGTKIAEDYMIPYNQKMFGTDLNALGTYWLNKLPNVSFEETLISCLEKKAYGTQPGHAEFFYPKKHGYGELWLRMAKALGDKIMYNEPVVSLDYENRLVNDKFSGEFIINTIPWTAIKEHINLPSGMGNIVNSLKHSSIVVNYVADNLDTKAQWIYSPDSALDYHRILVRHNFCHDSKGYWTETNLDRFRKENTETDFHYINDYAYPLNTIGKPEAMNKLLTWCHEKGIEGLGRWGEWQHYNSDVVVDLALEKANEMINA